MQGFEHGEDPSQDEPLELSFDDGLSPGTESASESAPESTSPPSAGPEDTPSESAPDAPELSMAPEVSAAPELSMAPEVSAAPEPSMAPEVSAAPEPSTAPELSAAPEMLGGASRPAENARVISPGEAFQDDWTGGEGAGDFLELDGELGQTFQFPGPEESAAQAAPVQLELEPDAPPEPAPSEAGMMGVDELDPLAPEYASGLVPSEDPEEYEGELEEDEYGEFDEFDEEGQEVAAAPSSRRALALKVVAGFAVGLAMAVAMTKLDLDSFFGGEAVELVSTGPAADGAAPEAGAELAGGPLPVASGAGPLVPTGDTHTERGPADVVAPEGPPGGLVAQFVSSVPAPTALSQAGQGTSLAEADPVSTAPPEFLEPFEPAGAGETVAVLVPGGGGGAADAQPGVSELTDEVPATGGPTGVQPTGEVALAAMPSEVLAMLDGVTHILQGSEVPMDRINSPVQIMTPSVGIVRAELEGGDVFEGRLYAVGLGRIWVDTKIGRMGLRSEALYSVERITTAGAEIGVLALDGLAGKQVRALTAGGRFVYGKLLRTREGRATLRTPTGGRITVDEAALELVGDHPSVRIK